MIDWHALQIMGTVTALWASSGLAVALAFLSFYKGVWISFPRIVACVFFTVAAPSLAVKFYNQDRAYLEGLFMSLGVVIVMGEELVQAFLAHRRHRRTERRNGHA